MEKIKNCPFCGGKPTKWYACELNSCFIDCSNNDCLIKPEITIQGLSTEKAIEIWNTRAKGG